MVTDGSRDDLGDAELHAPGEARALAASYARMDGVGFLFGSIANLATGVVVGVEVLPRPRYAAFSDVLNAARGIRRTALNAGMAAAGLRWSAERRVRMPVHLDLLAETLAGPAEVLDEVHTALGETEIDPAWVVLEVGVPADGPQAVLASWNRLRERGYRLMLDGVRAHDPVLPLLSALRPDQVKLHAELIVGLEHEVRAQALADLVRTCQDAGVEIVADGIETAEQVEILRGQAVRRGQGRLLAVPGRRPLTQLTPTVTAPGHTATVPIAARPSDTGGATGGVGGVGGVARAATTVPVAATGEQVRSIFADAPQVTSVVLIDESSRPVGTLDRDRFMLSVSGLYGHALHARRPVRPMADEPRVLAASADPREALALVSNGDPGRRNDDVVVVDDSGRCIGIAHITDLLSGIAELEYERALELHPVTGLPGSRAVQRAIDRRLAAREGFAVGWLVADVEPLVDQYGFTAAETAVRALARAVTRTARAGQRTGHGVRVPEQGRGRGRVNAAVGPQAVMAGAVAPGAGGETAGPTGAGMTGTLARDAVLPGAVLPGGSGPVLPGGSGQGAVRLGAVGAGGPGAVGQDAVGQDGLAVLTPGSGAVGRGGVAPGAAARGAGARDAVAGSGRPRVDGASRYGVRGLAGVGGGVSGTDGQSNGELGLTGADVGHVLDRIVVVTAVDGAEAFDAAVRRQVRGRAEVHSVWLTCRPGDASSATEINSSLARLLGRARATGPNTALAATPATVMPPRQPRVLSAPPAGLRDAPV